MGETVGEAVFSTGMTGYQETLTDPSYHRQVVVMTAPHVGNTGWNDEDDESARIWVSGFVVRDPALRPSSWRSRRSLADELADQGVVGISDIDTRALTRHLRERGAMRVGIFSGDAADRPMGELVEVVRSAPAMTGASLAAEVARTGSPELATVLEWSLAVNREIEQNMEPVPPFPAAVACLRQMQGRSDAIVVSQTPEEALLREWRQHGIEPLVRIIAGQELGSKADHIRLATRGKYAMDRVLLIGDAPGDLAAAREAGVSFYPIQPGAEVAAWERFHGEIYALFLAGRYRGELERGLVAAFEQSLAFEMDA